MRTKFFLSFICALSTIISFAQTPRTLHIVAPPSPETNWTKVREKQVTFAQTMEEWGIGFEIEHKDEIEMENSPDLLNFTMGWESFDKIKIGIGFKTPANPLGEKFGFTYSGEFSPEVTKSATKGEVEFPNGIKFSGGITTDSQRGLGYELGYELEKAFVALKGTLAGNVKELTSHKIEVSLTKLYNFLGGVENKEEGTNVKLVLDPEKYIRRFIQFAPKFIELAENPGKEAVNAVVFSCNPVLVNAAISNDASLWAKQIATVNILQALKDEVPKGVKIKYNENLLTELLLKGKSHSNGNRLNELAENLLKNDDPDMRNGLVKTYINQIKKDANANKQTHSPKTIALISLRTLVTKAEEYIGNWTNKPTELNSPGNISRIVGYKIDKTHNDILLIGEKIEGSPLLTLDDLIVGIRTVWKEDGTPFCSLDPDPVDICGEQHVRIGGIPPDSHFAQTMLDADYLMKKMLAGVVAVKSLTYIKFQDLIKQNSSFGDSGDVSSRFWFYPAPLSSGDIEISSDGTVILFNAGIQVLSEQMVVSHEGLVGTGKVDDTFDQWAAGLTKALPELEKEYPEYRHLHGLFDIVLLAKTWQKLDIDTSLISRLASLPYVQTKIPSTYKGIQASYILSGNINLFLCGGVKVRANANSHSWFVNDQPAYTSLTASASEMNGETQRSLNIESILIPAGSVRGSNLTDASTILALLRTGATAQAQLGLNKLIAADPHDPELWCIQALLNLQTQQYNVAIANAKQAIELEPENLSSVSFANLIMFQAHYLSGKTDLALIDANEAASAIPESPNAHIFKGDLLVALERVPEARAEYLKALELDSASVIAKVNYGLLLISEGWVVKGKSFIDKAKISMKAGMEIPRVKSAMAMTELGMAVLGNEETHFANAGKYADEALADPASDPTTRMFALIVKATLALGKNQINEADDFVSQAMKIAPTNPGPLLMMVEWQHSEKNDVSARKYLDKAELIAPDYPAVKKYRELLKN